MQKTKGSALVTAEKSLPDSHMSSTVSWSPFSCCTMQPTLLLKRRERLPFCKLLPCADLSFFKRRLFLLHTPRMSQILSVPSWEAVYSNSLWICNNRVTQHQTARLRTSTTQNQSERSLNWSLRPNSASQEPVQIITKTAGVG